MIPSMQNPVRIGLIGCGAISGAYLKASKHFPILQFVAAADLNREAAEKRAAEFGIPRVLTLEELLRDPDIELILNLTVPKAHVPISTAALQAGKHVYVEKPLAVSRDSGMQLMSLAAEKKLLVGCAPDTFLGSGLQTARRAIDDGSIGRPVAFSAFMMCPGHEHWHASPEFFYEVGGGPMLDMGPYYVTALLNLLGPVKRLSGFVSIAIPQRTISSQPKAGKIITVETPDHIAGLIEFENGATGPLVTSFATRFPQVSGATPITIFGTEGTLLVPDPNGFSGAVKLRRNADAEFTVVPPVFEQKYERSIGLADMATSIRTGQPFRATGQQAMAALDLMLGFLDSSDANRAYTPLVQYERPSPMPTEPAFGYTD